MTGPGEEKIIPQVTPAWGRLCELVCHQRLDWDEFDIRGAMRDVDARGVPYVSVAGLLPGLSLDLAVNTRTVLKALSELEGRTPGPAEPRPGSAAIAALRDGDWGTARRLLGTASVIPGQPPAPATETTDTE